MMDFIKNHIHSNLNASVFNGSLPSSQPQHDNHLEWAAALGGGFPLGIVLLGILPFLSFWLRSNEPKLVTKTSYVGYRSWFEPTWLVRMRWAWDAKNILTKAYQQVR